MKDNTQFVMVSKESLCYEDQTTISKETSPKNTYIYKVSITYLQILVLTTQTFAVCKFETHDSYLCSSQREPLGRIGLQSLYIMESFFSVLYSSSGRSPWCHWVFSPNLHHIRFPARVYQRTLHRLLRYRIRQFRLRGHLLHWNVPHA